VVSYDRDGQDCTSPIFLVGAHPLEWPPGLDSAKPIACDATAGSDLDAVAASWTIEAEEDGTALHRHRLAYKPSDLPASSVRPGVRPGGPPRLSPGADAGPAAPQAPP
jgi:hypothetical protein